MKLIPALVCFPLTTAPSACSVETGSTREIASLPDTPENREAQARRYLQVVSPRGRLDQIIAAVVKVMPDEEARSFPERLRQTLDMDALTDIAVAGMKKHFAADEFRALSEFYEFPVGSSAMNKFGAYATEIMPEIQRPVM